MKMTYNSVAIHAIGRVSVMEESSKLEPADSPQEEIVTMRIRVDVWQRTFTENRALLLSAAAALKTVHGVLKIEQELDPDDPNSTTLVLVNQTAKLTESGLPSDPNEWGTMHQRLVLTFEFVRRGLTTNSLAMTITPADSTPPFTMGYVAGVKESYRVSRYSETHDPRSMVKGSLTAHGKLPGDMGMSLAARRADLESQKSSLKAALLKKSVGCVYGDFNQTIKVEEVDIDVDQEVEHILWSFSASFTKFPNESGFAGCQYDSNVKEGEDGDLVLTFSGQVLATDELRARAKFAALRMVVLSANGYASTDLLRTEVSVKAASQSSFTDTEEDVGDGSTFVELNFSEEYLRRDPTHLSWTLSVEPREESNTGLITMVYSGSVTCGYAAGTVNAAYTTNIDRAYSLAVKKARLLGEGKPGRRLGGSIKRDDRQISKDATPEFVKLDFQFSYQVAGPRVYAEVSSETQYNKDGEDTMTLSGFIVGGGESAMTACYNDIVSVVVGNVLRSKTEKWSDNRLGNGSFNWADGDSLTPPSPLNVFTATQGYDTLKHRFDFNRVYLVKKTAAFNARYGIKVRFDYRTLTKTVTLDGTAYGNEADVSASQDPTQTSELKTLIDGLISAQNSPVHDLTGVQVLEQTRGLAKEYDKASSDGTTGSGVTMSIDFSDTYELELSTEDKVIECSLDEDILFSNIRNVEQPIPDGPSIIQQCGTTPARRTLKGSVTATDETTALKWVKRQRTTSFTRYPATSSETGIGAAPTVTFPEAPRIGIRHVFKPFLAGEIRGEDSGPKLVEVTFEFAEIIPEYAYLG